MKWLALLAVFAVNPAFACLQNGSLTLCAGDKVVVEDGDGYVVAINPIEAKVSVDFSRGKSRYSGISTYDIEKVSVGKGCMKGYCVGDKAVKEDGDGVVIAVNPLARSVSLDFSSGKSRYSGIGTYRMDQVAIGKGCMIGYCVGDTAVVDDGDGIVIGINPFSREAAIDFSSGRSRYSGIGTYALNRVSIGSMCAEYGPRNTVRFSKDWSGFGTRRMSRR